MGETKRQLQRTIEDIHRYEAILKLLQDNPDEMSHLHVPLVQLHLQVPLPDEVPV